MSKSGKRGLYFVVGLKTYENQWFWEVEEWKTVTVLLYCLKTYENLWLWEVEEWKTLTVLLFCLKTFENNRFWELEEHHSQVLDTPGLAKLCWHKVRCLQGGSRASKPVLVHSNGNVSFLVKGK